MHSITEVMIVGNNGIDGIGTGVRLVVDPDCPPLYPFRIWCQPDKEKTEESCDPELDTQPEAGLDVYTDAGGTEGLECL